MVSFAFNCRSAVLAPGSEFDMLPFNLGLRLKGQQLSGACSSYSQLLEAERQA